MKMENLLPPKARLRARHAVPYGGMFVLNRNDIGLVGAATAFDGLLRSCREWRKANGWPVGLGFEDEVEQALYATGKYNAEFELQDARIPNRRRNYNINDVVVGTRTMYAVKTNPEPLVDISEAERRAAICAGCPNNLSFSKPCGGICPELETVVRAIVGSARTSKDAELRQCAVCSCFLGVAVFVKTELQVNGLTQEQKQQFLYAHEQVKCWKGEWLAKQNAN